MLAPLVVVRLCGWVMMAGYCRATTTRETMLLVALGSCSMAVTVARLVSVPEAVTEQVMVTVISAPVLKSPREQVTVPPDWAQLPPLLETARNGALSGNGSVR